MASHAGEGGVRPGPSDTPLLLVRLPLSATAVSTDSPGLPGPFQIFLAQTHPHFSGTTILPTSSSGFRAFHPKLPAPSSLFPVGFPFSPAIPPLQPNRSAWATRTPSGVSVPAGEQNLLAESPHFPNSSPAGSSFIEAIRPARQSGSKVKAPSFAMNPFQTGTVFQ